MKENALSSSRLEWIDICRGIGILLVVLGHSAPPFKLYIYAFHIPLFFLVSGYLWNSRYSFKTTLVKSLKRYIIPYFILSILNLCIEMFFLLIQKESFDVVGKYIIGIIYSRGNHEWMPNCGPLWFLTALFCSILIYKIIDLSYKKMFTKSLTVVIVSVLGYVISLTDIPKMPWNLDVALVSVLFLHLGRIVKSVGIMETLKLPSKAMLSVVFAILSFVGVYFNQVEVNFVDNTYGNFFFMLLGSIPISLVVMIISERTSHLLKFKMLSFLGSHTLFIMAFDFFSGRIVQNTSRMLWGIDFEYWYSGEGLSWLVFFISKILVLSIGIIIWKFITNKIPNSQIRAMLSY